MDEKVLINGFGFSGYRSFGDGLTKIGPLQKVNFIIGKNNSGKSNIIKFLDEQYVHFTHKIGKSSPISTRPNGDHFEEIDFHISPNQKVLHRVSFLLLQGRIEEHLEQILKSYRVEPYHIACARKLLTSDKLVGANGEIWFTYFGERITSTFELDIDVERIESALNTHEWVGAWSGLNGGARPSYGGHRLVREVVEGLLVPEKKVPDIVVIPAIRKISADGSDDRDFSGAGIVQRLNKIKNPTLANQSDELKFEALNVFVRQVLDSDSAELKIPHDNETLYVEMDGKRLPIDSLGTGVHEVIILGAAATILDNTIICVEEPELHLHPLLQRKLIRYISDSTANQYFFTSHSAHLLDAVEAEIFHVLQVKGESQVTRISSSKGRSSICNDLGYKASDILQSNCVIWVEGPSDRIYINYWIKNVDPELVEGIHYSVMFFGGKLFSHVSGLDVEELADELEDFISLRQLNRHSAIVFDSDKASPRSKLTKTKQRLKAEFGGEDGFVWVTKGREIENYLDSDQLEKSILSAHPKSLGIVSKDTYSNLLKYKMFGTEKVIQKKKAVQVDKIRTAKKVNVSRDYVSNNEVNLSVLDLKNRVHDLVKYIAKANGKEMATS